MNAYVAQVKRYLVDMLHRERERNLPNKTPLPDYSMAQLDAELTKATSLFVCTACGPDRPWTAAHALSARDIGLHWQTAHPELEWNDGWRPSTNAIQARVPWMKAMQDGEVDAKTVLNALGFNEHVAHSVMDDLVIDGRLVCSCWSPAEMTGWAMLVSQSGAGVCL